MITKERLEELIKEGATVWESKYGKVKEFDLSTIGDFFMSKEYIKVHFYQPHNFITRKRFSRLFENKEDAEFSKYQNITRTETLNLPTWEEISNRKEYSLSFCAKQSRYCLGIDMPYRKDEGCIVLVRHSDPASRLVFERIPATKANYLEACELCRKLFLGEE